jgi:ectoine hydroxylase-related dioxygenase (phytanoyl-CoA dioxygenase family)
MVTSAALGFQGDVGVFRETELDGLAAFLDEYGFAILRGVFSEDELVTLQSDLQRQQQRLIAGELDSRHGTVILDDPDAVIDGRLFAHYVCFSTQCSTVADEAVNRPELQAVARRLLGDGVWLLDYERFGVVYQDARPGDQSGYSRIGWHSDWQSGPHLDIWPSVAFTLHLDATSPANGFLRVLPGSHKHGTEGMPLGFEKVPGEIAVYAERGDVLWHHANLWHSAARATDDGPGAIRRHVRGGWFAGTPLEVGHGVDDFVKNARR